MKQRLKRLLPFLLCTAIVGWLFASADLDAVVRAIESADLVHFVATIALCAIGLFAVDAWTLQLLLRRLAAERQITYRNALKVKGVSYFLNAINYSAGAGAMAFLLKRLHGVPLLYGASLLIWLALVDVAALITLLTAGWLLAADELPAGYGANLPWILAIAWSLLLLLAVYWLGGVDFFVLGRFRRWRLLEAFDRATWRDTLAIWGARLVFLLAYMLFDWLVLFSFDITPPLTAMLIYSPILAFMQIVPGSISGLGAVQPVIIALYTPWVAPHIADPEAQVLAFSTAFGPATTLVRLAIGYAFLGGVSRQLLRDATADPTDKD